MSKDKEMSRAELDKMVDEILAGTASGHSEDSFSLPGDNDYPAGFGVPPVSEEAVQTEDTAEDVQLPEVVEVPDVAAPESEQAEEAAKPEDSPAEEAESVPDKTGAFEIPDMISESTESEPGEVADEQAAEPEDAPETAAEPAAIKSEQPEKKEKNGKSGKGKKKKAPEIKPMKPIFCFANIAYSAVVFVGLAAAFIFLPRGNVSEIEQRSLAAFPTFSTEGFVNGEYTNGITEYFNDNVPYRDELKKAGAQLQSLFGVSYGDAKIMGPVAVITEAEEEEPIVEITTAATTEATTTAGTSRTSQTARTTAETTAEATTTTPETTVPIETEPVETTKNVNEVAPGVVTNGQVVTKLSDGHWWGISLFGGGKGTTYAACLNKFKELLGDSVNVYSMPIPTSGEYYLPPGYESYNASHQKSINSIDEQLVGVTPVPASMELWRHINETIYLRTDHHWQPLGAYYAAQTFAKYADVPFADISTMEQVDVPGYVGTMYGFTNDSNILNDPEVFTYYKPTNSYTTYYYDTAYNYDYSLPFFVPMPTGSMYSTFMGADSKIVRIKTDVGNGRKLIVFKDSYGNAEIPFYFGSFEEIWVCDMRYFDLNGIEFVKFTGATDLLFSMCTFSAVGTNAKGLQTILNNPVTEIKEGAPG